MEKLKVLGWAAFLILLVVGLAAAWPGEAPAQSGRVWQPVQYEEEPEEVPARQPGFSGALDITIQSLDGQTYAPGEVLLSDPWGEFAGYDPRNNYTYQDIPGSSYGWQPIPGAAGQYLGELYISNAPSGTYSLRVIGSGSGRYKLNLKGYDAAQSRAEAEFIALIEPGAIHHYVVNYSNRGGARLEARRTRITY